MDLDSLTEGSLQKALSKGELDRSRQGIGSVAVESVSFGGYSIAERPIEPKELTEKAIISEIILVDLEFIQENGACRSLPAEVFFPTTDDRKERNRQVKIAKRVCNEECAIRDECLEFALDTKQKFGVWGGKSETERKRLLRGWKSAV